MSATTSHSTFHRVFTYPAVIQSAISLGLLLISAFFMNINEDHPKEGISAICTCMYLISISNQTLYLLPVLAPVAHTLCFQSTHIVSYNDGHVNHVAGYLPKIAGPVEVWALSAMLASEVQSLTRQAFCDLIPVLEFQAQKDVRIKKIDSKYQSTFHELWVVQRPDQPFPYKLAHITGEVATQSD